MRAQTLAGWLCGAGATLAACAALMGSPAWFLPWVGASFGLVCTPSLAGSPGACLAGIGIAALAASPALGLVDGSVLCIAGCAAIGLSLWLSWRSRRDAAPRDSASHAAAVGLALAVVALCTVARTVLVPCSALAGPDLPGLAACVAGLALATALGAGVARFLCSRHRVERPLLILAAGAAAAAFVFALPHEFEPWLGRARALHAPDVSRTQFLAGSALLVLLVAGPAGVALGGLLGALAERAGRGRRATFAVAAGIALGFAALPGVRDAPAACAIAAVAVVVRPLALALVVGVVAVAAGAFEVKRAHEDPPTPAVVAEALAHADRLYVDLGHAGPIARPDDEPAPGWPSDDGLRGIVRWLDRIAPRGAIAVPPDVASWAASLGASDERAWFGFDESRFNRDAGPIAAAWLRPASPDPALGASCETRPRVVAGGVVVRPIDLWRAAPIDVEAWLAAAPAAEVVLFSRFAATVEHVGSPPASGTATDRGPWTAFERADAALPLTSRRVRFGATLATARTRLAPDLPRTGANALVALLGRSNRLGALDAPGFDARARIELALAILVDDSGEQDRLLRLLETRHASAVAGMRRERRAAQERLLRRLLRETVDDRTNADARFRLGAVLARGIAPLAGVEELTACVQFRPTLVAAYDELGRAYLSAVRTNQRKWTPKGTLDVNYAVENLVIMIHTDTIAPPEHARMLSLLGAARREKAARVPAERDPLLHDAVGIFRAALDLDPYEIDAARLMAATLLDVHEEAPARAYARDAVTRWPLDPRARVVSSMTLRDTDRDAARAELEHAFRAGFEFPPPRTR